jgi:hypothetical protein
MPYQVQQFGASLPRARSYFKERVFAPKQNPRPPFNAVAAGMHEIAADDAAPVIEQGESWNESMK